MFYKIAAASNVEIEKKKYEIRKAVISEYSYIRETWVFLLLCYCELTVSWKKKNSLDLLADIKITYRKKKLFDRIAELASQIKSMLMRTFWFVYFLKLYFCCNRRLWWENTFTTKLLFNLVNLERLWQNKTLKHLVKPFLLTFIHYFF